MPSSSGLYDDSDGESGANILSPTDGYFNGRPAPSSDPLVRDPQQEERDAQEESDKAREAREAREASENSASAQARRQPQEIVRSPVSRRFLPDWEEERQTENSPLIPPPSRSPAPPAYEDATAGSSSPHAQPSNNRPATSERNNYNTIGRGPIFLPDGQPEDLGGESPRDNSEQPFRKRWSDWPWERFRPKHLVLMAATICVLAFIISVIMRIVSAVHESHQQPIGGSPPTGPSSCPTARDITSGYFDFGDSDIFHLNQGFVDYDSHETPRIVRSSGEIHIVPTPQLGRNLIQARIVMHYSDSALVTNTMWYQKLDRLQINVPSSLSAKTPGLSAKPCTHTIVTVYVSVGTPINLIEVTATSFPVTFHNDLSLVADRLSVSTTSGDIAFPTELGNTSALNVRSIIVDSTSGTITGSYRLLDLLKVTSHSGSIAIDIEPCEVAVEDPKPAQLILHTLSGSITARTPAMFRAFTEEGKSTVPPRDYRSAVSTSSGSIHVGLIHGSKTSVGCNSGRIDATLAPYGFLKARSDIDVSSHSGSIDTTVLPSLSDPGEPMRYLWSSYRYTSGSLRMTYPSDWEGKIEGSTISGSITVEWPGVKVLEGGDSGVGFRRLRAIKGKGDATTSFNGISGSARIMGPSDGRRYGKGAPKTGDDWWGGGLPRPRWPGYDHEWESSAGNQKRALQSVKGGSQLMEE